MDHSLLRDANASPPRFQEASWHPALRPDRNPSPTPKAVQAHAEDLTGSGVGDENRLDNEKAWQPSSEPETPQLSHQDRSSEDQSSPCLFPETQPAPSLPNEDTIPSSPPDLGDEPSYLPASRVPTKVPNQELHSSPRLDGPAAESINMRVSKNVGLKPPELPEDAGIGNRESDDTKRHSSANEDPSAESLLESSGASTKPARSEEFGLHFGGDTPENNSSFEEHDTSWTEHDKVDPAWGIARTESEVFSRLSQVQRSNTFPEVPSLDTAESTSLLRNKLAPIQAQSIAEEEFLPQDLHTDAWNDESLQESAENHFFEDLGDQNGRLATPPDAESRFEEGLPLVDHAATEAEPELPEHPAEKSYDSLFDSTVTAEDDFFNSTPADGEINASSSPPALDRKNTSQILGSMDYIPSHPNHHTSAHDEKPIADTPEQNIEASWMNESPGKMAVPLSEPPSSAEQVFEAPEAPRKEDLDALWKAALGDDDLLEEDADEFLPDDEDGFLPDDGDGFLPDDEWLGHQSGANAEDKSFEQTMAQAIPPNIDVSLSNAHAPPQPSSTALISPVYGGFSSALPTSATSGLGAQTAQRPAAPKQAESFVDQAREGYKSPYDLPTEFSRPKRRVAPAMPSPSIGSVPPPPPPRISSMNSTQPTAFSEPTQPSQPPQSHGLPRPQQTPLGQLSVRSTVPPISPEKPKPRTGSSSFFEELPVVPKTRSSIGTRGLSQQSLPTPPLPRPAPHTFPPPSQTQEQPTVQQQPIDPYAQFQLQPPPPMDPYANVPQSSLSTPSPAGLALRYSPRPASNNSVSKASRYSPAPPHPNGVQQANKYASQPAAPPPPAIHPFQPRTSSPLAVHEKNAYNETHQSSSNDINRLPPTTQTFETRNITPPKEPYSMVTEPYGSPSRRERHQPEYHPRLESIPSRTAVQNQQVPFTPIEQIQPRVPQTVPSTGPPSYNAQYQSNQNAVDLPFSPPRRSQTQSPGKRGAEPSVPASSYYPIQRPASVHDPSSPVTMNPYANFPAHSTGRARGLTQNLDFIPPTDGTEHDPLQRWRGSAIVGFGFGGTLLTTLPKHIPRYTAGQSVPMIKSSPGEIRLQTVKEILPPELQSPIFPGPLRSKAKKKEVLTWLSARIDALEQQPLPQNYAALLPDPSKRYEEKLLLWKIVRAMVEFDGQLDGNPEIQTAVSAIISPETSTQGLSGPAYVTGSGLAGISKHQGSAIHRDPVDPSALESVRMSLLQGNREKAVWDAVDRRLWAHAMLISSTMNKDIWKQVVQEFVRQEVKTVGQNTESLAVLYEIFAGNWQESIDELVPPSARAGLQMVSKVASSGPTKNALDGLDRWRETLALVLSNRTPDDQQALTALGNLLATYGRIEAAHICHLFTKISGATSAFGGMNDSQASIVLLGGDHLRFPFDFIREEDSILLTEVYEFAVSVLGTSASGTLPHLQAFKLLRAAMLAENGLKTEAQQYCDAIGTVLKSTTKISPYYTPQLFEQLKDLSDRLAQAPSEGSSSWIFKPSMEKVSGSLWGKFSNFVAGDESDGESRGSGKAEGDFGPFAKVVGTPTISRSGSQTDLHSFHAMTGQGAPNTSSRYAPAGPYAPRSSSEQQRPPSFEQQRPSPYAPSNPSQPRHEPLERAISNMGVQFAAQGSPYQPLSHSPNDPSGMFGYQPTPPQTAHSPLPPVESFVAPSTQQASYFPTPPNEPSPSFGGYQPQSSLEASSQYNESRMPEPVQSSYEPPSAPMGYEPPSYTPPTDEPLPDVQEESSPVEEKQKKKSFMDDDDEDDFATRAAALKKAEKEAKNRAADEAFRKAAEADASKKPDLNKKPSGWFGGWFGNKDPNGPPPSGPIRAKLGEESSFVYDPELKKWINKKDPNSATAAAKSTPPPPRTGPPSRSASRTEGPPMSGPSRSVSSPMGVSPSLQSTQSLPTSTSMSPFATTITPGLAPTSSPRIGTGPPSRTSSPGFAGDSAIPTPSVLPPGISPPIAPPSGPTMTAPAPPLASISRPGTAVSNASSIDDLLGAPQARKAGSGGTARAKKKGRGYVDVMAK